MRSQNQVSILEKKNKKCVRLMKAAKKKCNCCCIYTEDLRIDHDLHTGKVRGLLCNNCKVIISLAQEDSHTLQKISDYLRKKANNHPNLPVYLYLDDTEDGQEI